ncbi:unnamed protein product [Blepharisma stoltei]|uniref:Pre-mRNA-processing factor 19 n=1 Tax=Blepharisma stoltei TaxID=1481888 RepID=A0AAU9K2Q9_9CILI|nr:unnamed protein product [Blepharisma stoltei]
MSVTHCALSGQPLIDPVVSVKTGHVYERSAITKYIQSTGRCPITNVELSLPDIISLQANPSAKPRPLSQNSIPGLIDAFKNEWDAVVIETHELKKYIDVLRQELSHSLYQYDAACRVIARLVKEKDELVHALQELNKEDKE